jgi:two-component system OmpR family sensor kinase/two-component system sensor histidine kinase BaeS
VLSSLLAGTGFPVAGGQLPLLALGIGAGLVLVLAVFVATMRRVGMPMGEIVAAADRVASGEFSTRVREFGPPWLRSVARAFNSMTARLEAQDAQRRHLMADIAHELRTPLTVIQGRLEGLVDGVYARDDARLEELLQDTRMLGRLVEDLRTLANAERGALTLQKEATDLSVLVQDVVKAAASEAAQRQVALRADASPDLPLVEIDPIRIREVLSNLIANAMRHTDAGGTISIAAAAAPNRITVAVTDTGSGIEPQDLPRIFDRFYKGGTSHGSGLGLTIARNLVLAHGGEIHAASEPGRGTTITFTVPVD